MTGQPAAEPAPLLSPRRSRVAHAWISVPVYELLVIEAERRGDHPDRLAAALLNVVLLEDWTKTLLDERL